MGMISEFKDFALKGNVVDMAVGIVIGAAFGKIVTSLVENIIMPPIGLLMGGVDFSQMGLKLQDGVAETTDEAGEVVPAVAEVVVGYGEFINTIINFLIIAFAIFLVVKMINKAQAAMTAEEEAKPAEPSTEEKLLTEIRDALKSN